MCTVVDELACIVMPWFLLVLFLVSVLVCSLSASVQGFLFVTLYFVFQSGLCCHLVCSGFVTLLTTMFKATLFLHLVCILVVCTLFPDLVGSRVLCF